MKGGNARARISIKQLHQLQKDRPRDRFCEQIGEHIRPGDVFEAQNLLGDEVRDGHGQVGGKLQNPALRQTVCRKRSGTPGHTNVPGAQCARVPGAIFPSGLLVVLSYFIHDRP